MTFRPLIPALAVSVSFMAFAGTVGSASAQTALSGCDPATGLGQNGQPCVELTPLDPNRITNVAPGADGENQYRPLDTTTLGQTYACREVNAAGGTGPSGTLLIEDCGTPLTGAELGNLQPYYGTTGAPAPAPAPVPAPPPPAPVVAAAPPPPPPPLPPLPAPGPVVVAAPTAPVAVPAVGLGNAGLIAAGVGAAAVVGLAIVALDDDDDSASATSTAQ